MNDIRQRLFELRDNEKYRRFSAPLIPNIDERSIIGVRTPVLRKFASEIFADKARSESFMSDLPHRYYEENNLHSLLIGLMRSEDSVYESLESFLPFVDNWSTCDMLRPHFEIFDKQRLLENIHLWVGSEQEYTVRFGLEMLMVHFLDSDFDPEYLALAASVKREEYYIKMMVAWFFAEALAKQYESAVKVVEAGLPDKWTHNKSIQKARESLRISDERKAYLKSLRK